MTKQYSQLCYSAGGMIVKRKLRKRYVNTLSSDPKPRLQDLPPVILDMIVSRLGPGDRYNLRHSARGTGAASAAAGSTVLAHKLGLTRNHVTLLLNDDVEVIASYTKSVTSDISHLLRAAVSGMLDNVTALRTWGHDTEGPVAPHRREACLHPDSTLGRRLTGAKLSFPSLSSIGMEPWTARTLDLVRHLPNIAPNLRTLLIDVRECVAHDFRGAWSCRLEEVRVLCSYVPGCLAAVRQLLRNCPAAKRVWFEVQSRDVGGRFAINAPWQVEPLFVPLDFLRFLFGLPLDHLEWRIGVLSFAKLMSQVASEGDSPTSGARKIALLNWSFEHVTYLLDTKSEPTRGMIPEFARCLRAGPRLDTFLSYRRGQVFPLSDPPIDNIYGSISSFVHPTGEGELLYAVLLVKEEWEHVTDYLGHPVPLDIFEDMRLAEVNNPDRVEWEGRGVVVGDQAWGVLENWYATVS